MCNGHDSFYFSPSSDDKLLRCQYCDDIPSEREKEVERERERERESLSFKKLYNHSDMERFKRVPARNSLLCFQRIPPHLCDVRHLATTGTRSKLPRTYIGTSLFRP